MSAQKRKLERIFEDFQDGLTLDAMAFKHKMTKLEIFNILMDFSNLLELDKSYNG